MMVMARNEYGIHFDYSGPHAQLEIGFDGVDGEPDWDLVDIDIDLATSKWEVSYYRRPERTFEVERVYVHEFGRLYQFNLEDILSSDEYDRFMEALAEAYDEEMAERRAESMID